MCNQLKLPKLKWVRFAHSKQVTGRILNATIRRNASGKYFVSLLVEQEIHELPKTGSSNGVDVGLELCYPVRRHGLQERTLLPNAREETSLRTAQALPPSTHRLEQESEAVRGEELSEAKAEGRPYPREDR